MLAWGALNYIEGYRRAGEVENLKRTLKWGADFLMASHPSKYKFLALVGTGTKWMPCKKQLHSKIMTWISNFRSETLFPTEDTGAAQRR